jgi:hypothetical protein
MIAEASYMAERHGLAFADDSILILPEGTSIETAKREATQFNNDDLSPRVRVVQVIARVLGDAKRKLH